ncbi:SulP family sulfate permease [Plasticicumulans lactativorans]|uniref:SulP family sulfate permease n=1 Tax=Plasticicumulans lactativorans TaxID=1133106 RepID=A0A4R2LF84_9GAMM|nr:C4-dicarboxylic acid transporter DauA [Plasticicumulans lactativorans]TCO83334.1 SulP family sulfate permease [Plasticicumulans lactativorans]
MKARVGNRAAIPFATALRETLARGYRGGDLRADALAGLTVGIVAVPLAMALAIGSGVPPQYGLYTSIVAGVLIALTGGARYNVSGPTAAFIVILLPIATRYGVGGLVTASCLAGVMLLLMGLARMGRLIQFIPYPVTTGFTAGIGVVIASLQFKDFFGLSLPHAPESFLERVHLVVQALPGAHLPDLLIGAATLAVLVLWPRLRTPIPQHLAALAIGTVLAWGLTHSISGFEVATIASRFSFTVGGQTHAGVPAILPQFVLPWSLPGADGAAVGLSLAMIEALIGPAMAIALLGAIESLLCAVVADGMTGTKHDPDAELVGQGIGNIVAPFFGGIAATGALARTATNIRAGARSPLAAVIHAAFILLVLLALAPLLGYLPMASLAALLLLVAWNMSEAKHFVRIMQIAPKSDVAVLLVCFGLTVIFDMVIAVSVGVVLAALLFMNRMAAFAGGTLFDGTEHPGLDAPLPNGVRLYAVAGPLFFGAAEKAMSTLHAIDEHCRAVILDLEDVPVMDMTGLVSLDSAITRLRKDGVFVAIAGIRAQPAAVLARSGIRERPGELIIQSNLRTAVNRVRQHLGEPGTEKPRITDAII